MNSLRSVSVVIPSLTSKPRTLESVPAGVEIAVVQEGNRAEARNLGVTRTSGEIIVFCDDDIRFSERFFYKYVKALNRGTIIGLEDFDFGFLLTRFMVVFKEDFERLGGFDAQFNHMEDTEFCLNALSNDLSLHAIGHSEVDHKEHESSGQDRWTTLKNTFKLAIRYPRYAPTLINGVT